MPDHPKIGYAGLGEIGLAMAINLVEYIKLQDLPPLAVWDESKDKYDKIHGSVGVDKLEDLITLKGCAIIFIHFPADISRDHRNVLLVCMEIEGKKGGIIVDQSKLHPKDSEQAREIGSDEWCEIGSKSGAFYLPSPIFGGAEAVANRSMISTIAGDTTAIKTVKPIIDWLGQATLVMDQAGSRSVQQVGPQAAQAQCLINMIHYESLQAFSDVYTLARAIKFPDHKLHELFETVLPATLSSHLLTYSRRMSERQFFDPTGVKLQDGFKDVKTLLDLSKHYRPSTVPLPALERVLVNLEKVKKLAAERADTITVEGVSAVQSQDAGVWNSSG